MIRHTFQSNISYIHLKTSGFFFFNNATQLGFTDTDIFMLEKVPLSAAESSLSLNVERPLRSFSVLPPKLYIWYTLGALRSTLDQDWVCSRSLVIPNNRHTDYTDVGCKLCMHRPCVRVHACDSSPSDRSQNSSGTAVLSVFALQPLFFLLISVQSWSGH